MRKQSGVFIESASVHLASSLRRTLVLLNFYSSIFKTLKLIILVFLFFISLTGFSQSKADSNLIKANSILNAIYKNYAAPNTNLLRENYPYDEKYTPDYLAANPGTVKPNEYAYLWPYSGTFSAAVVLFEATKDKQYKKLLDEKILPGLEKYLDVKRKPAGYASYINTEKPSDRFYDDNIWLGIDFTDLYHLTNQKTYLDKAKLIWEFVWSGHDEKLGGGIYWCEQKKFSKNTCSNAPAAVFALKLFNITKDSFYFHTGKSLYNWTQLHLQDTADVLYFDNISLTGKVDKKKYSYNSGQMMQAAVLLFHATRNQSYLKQAEAIAASAFHYFIVTTPQGIMRFKDQNAWFNAVMLRGFTALFEAGGRNHYLPQIQNLLNYYQQERDTNGLFYKTSRRKNNKWLLDQGGFAEMFARMAVANKRSK